MRVCIKAETLSVKTIYKYILKSKSVFSLFIFLINLKRHVYQIIQVNSFFINDSNFHMIFVKWLYHMQVTQGD